MIPKQLSKEGFRFIKLRTGSKLPMEKGWQKDKNYAFDDTEFLKFIKKNKIYGVVTGFDNLIVIDCDMKMTESIIEKYLPKTFKIKTPSSGTHFYYFSDLPSTRLLKHPTLEDSKGEPIHLGEIRSKGSQVVGPNSYNIKKRKFYKVEKDIDIAELPKETIEEVFAKYLTHQVEKKEWDGYERPMQKAVIKYFPLDKVMGEYGFDLTKNPTDCPWHYSKGGACLYYKNDTYHCFHCLRSGNVIHLVAEFNKITYREALKMLYLKLLKERK